MTDVHPMRLYEETDARLIYHLCHPGWPARALRWYEAHPTLVLESDREIVGYTSYALTMQPEVCSDGEVMLGYGIDIKPGHHGKGYGRRLCDERLKVARAVGAKLFVGHAAPDNHAMTRLFEADGFKHMGQRARYPDGTAMLIFNGPVQ